MRRIATGLALVLILLPASAGEPEVRTFALEMQGTVVGLATLTEETLEGGLVRRTHHAVMKLKLIGEPFDHHSKA